MKQQSRLCSLTEECKWTASLRDFSNPDKHRHIVPHQGEITVALFPDATRLRFLNLPGRVTRAKHPVSGTEVDVNIAVNVEILFGDGSPVIQTLNEIQASIASTLEAFKPDFK